MIVYSGEVPFGTVGTPTPFFDNQNKPLHVGDIVMVSAIDQQGICSNTGITAIVENTGECIGIPNGPFVMGIRDVDFMDKDKAEWIVQLVKSHEHVIAGENWPQWGFNYK